MAKVDAKVVLLGKEYSGKTSLIERFLHSRFCGDEVPYQNTIGAGYGAKRVDVFGREVFLGIWDTAGSERYQAMSKIYYRGAWAAVVCYDLTDPESWEKAKFWVHELWNNEPNCKVYYCGTKLDLLERDSTLRKVDSRTIQDFALTDSSTAAQNSDAYNDCSTRIFETSSRTGEGVTEVFLQIAKDFVKESKDRPPSHWNHSDSAFGLHGDQSSARNNSCKC